MKLIIKYFLSLMLVAGISACSKQESIGTVAGNVVTKEEYEAFLKLKNVPINDAERYERMKEQYVERIALTSAIESSEKLDVLLMDAEVEEFKRQLLISRYFEDHLNNSVSDEGIQNYYNLNEDKFQSEQVHVAHILFRVDPKMGETERQAVLSTAHDAYSKITSGGEFEEVAKALSEDTVSAKRGGDLGWINKGAVAPEFSEKAFSLSKSEVSEPFLTAFGFHIIKVLEAPQVVKKPFEAVKGDIRYQLRNEAKTAETQRLLDSVKHDVR